MSIYSYVKLFGSITESTVWCEPAGTRLVWITLMAKCDRLGRFTGSIPGLARLANVSLEEAQRAIETFLAPDPFSRTPDHEGRRIAEIDGGWRLLNHEKYRDMRDEEVRREQNREAKQRQRERDRYVSKDADSQQDVSEKADSQPHVSTTPTMSAHADAYASTGEAKAIGQRDAFAVFWSIYPKRVKRKSTREKWKAKGLGARAGEIIADVRNRIANDGRWLDGFVPDPLTYITQERWEDELQPPKVGSKHSAPPAEPRRTSGPDETRAMLDLQKAKKIASPKFVREAVLEMRRGERA